MKSSILMQGKQVASYERNIRFKRIDLSDSHFQANSTVEQPKFCDLSKAVFENCLMNNVNFSQANLSGAILSECEGERVSFGTSMPAKISAGSLTNGSWLVNIPNATFFENEVCIDFSFISSAVGDQLVGDYNQGSDTTAKIRLKPLKDEQTESTLRVVACIATEGDTHRLKYFLRIQDKKAIAMRSGKGMKEDIERFSSNLLGIKGPTKNEGGKEELIKEPTIHDWVSEWNKSGRVNGPPPIIIGPEIVPPLEKPAEQPADPNTQAPTTTPPA